MSTIAFQGKSTRLYYLRDEKNIQKRKNNRGFTRGNPIGLIASEVDFADKVIRYQVSMVYKKTETDVFGSVPVVLKDTFSKEIGRQIAVGKLMTRPIEIDDADTSSGHKIILQIMRDIERNELLPFRARKIATRWLNAPPFIKS